MDNKGYNRSGRPNKRFDRRGNFNSVRYNNTDDKSTEMTEGVIAGRNAVIELLKSGRCIDKLYVKKGELEGFLRS